MNVLLFFRMSVAYLVASFNLNKFRKGIGAQVVNPIHEISVFYERGVLECYNIYII